MMLEFMQQMESGRNISFSKALKEAVILDLLKMIPLAAVWAAIWVAISILNCAARKNRGGGGVSYSIFNRIQQAVRMAVFLALPAIAWENKGPFSAIAQSVRIIRKHSIEFLATYTLTALTGLLLAIPLLIICALCKSGVTFPTIFWAGVVIYVGFVWALGIYMEQMSFGLLYLWHLRWTENGSKGRLSSVPAPDLLDQVYELEHVTSRRSTDEQAVVEETDKRQLKFRTACRKAMADGKVTTEEKRQLTSLAEFFDIPKDIVKQILEDEIEIFRQRGDS